MNIAVWQKALKVIPNVSREEWGSLDLISKWLISTRHQQLVQRLYRLCARRGPEFVQGRVGSRVCNSNMESVTNGCYLFSSHPFGFRCVTYEYRGAHSLDFQPSL